ncbi:MAG: glutamine amidotransferase, partial [Firmicutes bacterium]|nr:glutamine amidotransferase [Bacillota bacterium]
MVIPLQLRVCHLYPDLMNTYGDRGDMLTIQRRCAWRGIEASIECVSLGAAPDLASYDVIFIGGGQDRQQKLIARDLLECKGESLRNAIRDGVVVLAVCGGYQLLGKYYRTQDGQQLPGLGVFDAWTEAGEGRFIGNVVIETSGLSGTEVFTVVGFENHSGRTYLGEGIRPLGRVLLGRGNNGKDGFEGAVHSNAIGTYLHGPLLPKNPKLCDDLVHTALRRRYG